MTALLLYSYYTDKMSYFNDWVDAFKDHPDYQSECLNVFNPEGKIQKIQKSIEKADLIILHHSMNGDTLKYLLPFTTAIKNRKGKLISFVGNEVNLPILGMAPKIKILKELDAEIIATQLPQEAGEWLYSDCTKSKVVSLPHALNPKAFYPISGQSRVLDIGTRSAHYGVYIGDNDRNNIVRFFHDNSKRLQLSVDLGLDHECQKRFNRVEWAKFLSSCKATLSTEAGSFYLQKDDYLIQQIQGYLRNKSKKWVLPNESQSGARKMYGMIIPSAIRKLINYYLREKLIEADMLDEDCNFDEIFQKFFSKTLKCPVYSKAISSRHFDAIGTKTLHIMYPGRYNDILKPNENYLELKKDHSNIDYIIEKLKDKKFIKAVTDRTYDYVISEHTHKKRLDFLLKEL
ncbi:MAG: hypothetical protein WCJ92_00035 [Alphaproteobacteria bacterium]